MNIEDLLDQIDEMLDSAWGFAGKSVLNADKLRDYIDDIRLNMPQEIKQARKRAENQESKLRIFHRGNSIFSIILYNRSRKIRNGRRFR